MNDATKKWLDDHSGCDFRKHVNEIRELDWGDQSPVVDDDLKFMGYTLSFNDMEALESGMGQSWDLIAGLVAIEHEDAILAGLEWDEGTSKMAGCMCWKIPAGEDE